MSNTGQPVSLSQSGASPKVAGGLRRHVLSWAPAVGAAVLVLLFVLSDSRKLWEAASRIDLLRMAVPVGCAIVSYLTMALSYQGIARAAGYPVPFTEMLKITLVANTMNNLVSTGGLSGFATRMYFFIKLGIPSGLAVTVSLLQTFLTNTLLLLFVVVGFGYLLSAGNLQGLALATTAILLFFFLFAAVISVILLFHRRVRRRTLFTLAEAANWLMHRFLPNRKPARIRIWRFQRNLNRSIDLLLSRKQAMLLPTMWIFLDWVVTILILWGGFFAAHYPIAPTYVVIGFAVGIILSLISFVPGGLGVMEGSMAAIFASLGVPFETAVIASLIFRVAYHVLPMVVSVFFFRGMLLQGARAAEQGETVGATDLAGTGDLTSPAE